jgi:hypothetical protein
MLKKYFLTALAALAMNACKKPEPPEKPEPPKPQPWLGRTFPTTASLGQVRGYIDSAALKVGGFDGYTLNIGDMPLTAEENDNLLADELMRAASQANLKVNKIGKVYTAGNSTDNKIVWSVGGFLAHGMPMRAAPNGAYPYAKDILEQAEFHKLGYASITTVELPVIVPKVELELTVENAARFDDYIDELKAQYPQGVILDIAGITIPEITLEKLVNLGTVFQNGIITIKDSDIRIKVIKSRKPIWGFGYGSNRLCEWMLLSRVHGIEPEIHWYGEKFQNDFASIDIRYDSANILHTWNGQSFAGFAAVSMAILPQKAMTFVDNTGLHWPGFSWWAFDCGRLAVVADKELEKLMHTMPVAAKDKLENTNIVYDYWGKCGIVPQNELSGTPKWIQNYTGAEMANEFPGTKILGLPEWTRDITPPSRAVAQARLNARGRGQ